MNYGIATTLLIGAHAIAIDGNLARREAAAQGLSAGGIAGYVIGIAVLICISGVTAGLTLGLMSLDETQLHVLAQSGSPAQKRHATKILPIRRNGHLLLVSLLLMNVIVNETLPLLSERLIGSGPVAVVLSTVLIVIFAEVLPQAVCSTHGLAIGAAMAVPVRCLIVLLFVVSWPVAKLLDLMLGQSHGMIYRRAELKELIDFHSQQNHHGGDLNIDAVTIMRGALDLQEKRVRDSMTSIENVFMLPKHARLDRATIGRIVESGHSRVPIYVEITEAPDQGYSEKRLRKQVTGCLLAKNLLLVDPDDETPLQRISVNHLPYVQDDLPLFDILNIFQEGRSHMAIVVPAPPQPTPELERTVSSGSQTTADPQVEPMRLWTESEMAELEPIGIITLEDVLEELIQEPIWDETDQAQQQLRPRAGLAIPLQGTGESLVLSTTRGRPSHRARSAKEAIELDDLRIDTSRPTSGMPSDAKLPDNLHQPIRLTNKHIAKLQRPPLSRPPSNSESPLRTSPTVGPTRPPSQTRFKSVSNRSSLAPIARRARSESDYVDGHV